MEVIQTYPSSDEVENADQYILCKWHRFLRNPEGGDEIVLNNRIFDRWGEAGGFTPQISKSIGW